MACSYVPHISPQNPYPALTIHIRLRQIWMVQAEYGFHQADMRAHMKKPWDNIYIFNCNLQINRCIYIQLLTNEEPSEHADNI
jgi:hypothetical protein